MPNEENNQGFPKRTDSGVWQINPETGEPEFVWDPPPPKTPQQIADDALIDGIWQKLYDNPSLDREMWNQMFGPEPEYTEEELEAEEEGAIEYGSPDWDLYRAEEKRRWEALAQEDMRRLHAGEPRLNRAQIKAIITDGKEPGQV